MNEEITTCSTQKSDHEIKKLWKKLFWGIEFLKKPEGNVVDRSTFFYNAIFNFLEILTYNALKIQRICIISAEHFVLN